MYIQVYARYIQNIVQFIYKVYANNIIFNLFRNYCRFNVVYIHYKVYSHQGAFLGYNLRLKKNRLCVAARSYFVYLTIIFYS